MNAPTQAAEFKGQFVQVDTEYEDAYILVVRGNCMAPDFEDGDYAVCSPSAPRKVGEIVTLEHASGARMLCRLVMDCPDDMWNIKGDVEGVMMVAVNNKPDMMKPIRTNKLVSAHAVIGRELPA